MKAEDVQKGRIYKARIGKKALIVRVREVVATPEYKEDGTTLRRTTFTYEVENPDSGKVYTVRSPSHFLDEVVKKPTKNDLVRIVMGTDSHGLDAAKVYRVKSVGPKNVVIANGKKDHKVPVGDVRVVDKEGEQSPPKQTGENVTTPSTNGSASSGKRPTRSTTPQVAGPVSEPKCETGPATALPVQSFDNDVLLTRANEDDGDAQEELVTLAVRAGYSMKEVHAAVNWEEVVGMIHNPRPPVRSVFPAREGGQWIESDFKSFELEPERKAACQSMDHLPNRSVIAQPAPLSQRLQKANTSRDDSPHLIVEARAGSGKTTTLVEGLKRVMGIPSPLVPSPQQAAVWEAMELSKGKVDSICFVAFNKAIAVELQKRVPAGVAAMTMHSMGFKAVMSRFGKVKVESYRVYNILSELYEEDIRDLKKRKFETLKAIEELVGMCKMNLVGFHQEFNDLDLHSDLWTNELDKLVSHYDIEIPPGQEDEVYAMVPRVLERCKDVQGDREIDYNDMVWLPIALDLKVTKYDMLLVDEAQDLNRCQQALAKKAGRRLILCGDPKQAIYGFAGADCESMNRMFEELNGKCPDCNGGVAYGCKDLGVQARCPVCQGTQKGRGCSRLPLTVTRRCGKAIVEEAKKLVPDFEAFESNGPGLVRRADYDDRKSKLTPEEKKLNPPDDYSKEVRDGDFILCRCNAPLVSQCFRFIKWGRKATIQGRDIGKGLTRLIEGFKAGSVEELVKKLSDWLHQETKKENAKRNPNDARLINLEDKHDCLLAFTEGQTTIEGVVAKIDSVFTDNKDVPGIKLSSIHRSKGLEAERVFFLMPESAACPHPMARSAWEIEQEYNLKYVGVTRAIKELIFVT